MGGFGGVVEGDTELATWKAYLAEVGDLARAAGQAERGMFVEVPRNKRDAYKRMQKLDSGKWALYYHFHSQE